MYIYICNIIFTHYKHPGVDCEISTLQRKLNLKNKSNQYSVGYLYSVGCFPTTHPPIRHRLDASGLGACGSQSTLWARTRLWIEGRMDGVSSNRRREFNGLKMNLPNKLNIVATGTVGRIFFGGCLFQPGKAIWSKKMADFLTGSDTSSDISSCTEGASSSAMYRKSSCFFIFLM